MELMQANKNWANRPDDECYATLDALKSAVTSRRAISRESVRSFGNLSVVPEHGGLTIANKAGHAVPTFSAFGQLCTQVGAPASYLRKLPPELAARNLNYSLRTNEIVEQDVQVLSCAYDDHTEIRSFNGPNYGRIWDAEVVELAETAVKRSDGKFYNPKSYDDNRNGLYASDHDVFIFMIDGGSQLDVGPRAELNRGFFTWNSETGARMFGCTIFYFNSACGNHIVWGAQHVQSVLIRHSKYGPKRFQREALDGLLRIAEQQDSTMADTVRRAQQYVLPKADDSDAVLMFLNEHGKFTKGESREAVTYALNEEGKCATLWDLIQGLTASARDYVHLDSRNNLEERAGKLLAIVAN